MGRHSFFFYLTFFLHKVSCQSLLYYGQQKNLHMFNKVVESHFDWLCHTNRRSFNANLARGWVKSKVEQIRDTTDAKRFNDGCSSTIHGSRARSSSVLPHGLSPSLSRAATAVLWPYNRLTIGLARAQSTPLSFKWSWFSGPWKAHYHNFCTLWTMFDFKA